MNDRVATAGMMPDRGAPTRLDSLVFAAKAFLLRLRRAALELAPGRGPALHRRADALAGAPMLASVRTPLWTSAGGARDHDLNAGKIENLRIALRGLDGVEVPAGAVLSFWRQIGRPVRRRGFVAGRELREGCMIASVGGGLCQLSNALYEAGLAAGLEIVERHPHTRIVPGSRAAAGRDATVFWNYLDLRMRGRGAFRIEARLTADMLEVTLRGAPAETADIALDFRAGIEAHDCLSCGRTDCHRHDPDDEAARPATAWLVDSGTREFVSLYAERAGPEDVLMLPTRLYGAPARAWPRRRAERTADLAALRRSLALRIAPAKAPLAGLMVAADARLAAAYARRLEPVHTRLVVAQSLLPHLWRLGVLQGRRFDVLMDRLPMDALQGALDLALARHPESPTLGDYRAPAALVAAEREALKSARRLITAHCAVAAHFPGRVERLGWAPATPLPARHGGRDFLLAGPALARKGAHSLRSAMAGLDMKLLVGPGAEEAPDFWAGLDVGRLAPGEQPEALAGVVLPAIVEHRPQTLPRALAAGLPVIATPACGLPPQPGLTLVAPDDVEGLRAALIAALRH